MVVNLKRHIDRWLWQLLVCSLRYSKEMRREQVGYMDSMTGCHRFALESDLSHISWHQLPEEEREKGRVESKVIFVASWLSDSGPSARRLGLLHWNLGDPYHLLTSRTSGWSRQAKYKENPRSGEPSIQSLLNPDHKFHFVRPYLMPEWITGEK